MFRCLLARIFSLIKSATSVVKSVDWSSIVVGVATAIKGSPSKTADGYMIIKPAILSDANILTAVSILRLVLSAIPVPGVALASPLLGLGTVGFDLWKRMAFSKAYDQLKIPPVDPNILKVFFLTTPALKAAYIDMLTIAEVSEENIEKLEKVYNDISFITNADFLVAKYPNIDAGFLRARAKRNLTVMQINIEQIEQAVLQKSNTPETHADAKKAFGLVKELFPAMSDWSLLKSDGFKNIVSIIDLAV